MTYWVVLRPGSVSRTFEVIVDDDNTALRIHIPDEVKLAPIFAFKGGRDDGVIPYHSRSNPQSCKWSVESATL
jgi:hypothetical protein